MNKSMKSQIKHIVILGVMTAIALTIFAIESLIPPLVSIPGIKLGLSNIITLFALVIMGPKDAFIILIMRVFLGSVFSGQMMTFAYSITGGILCLLVETLLIKILPLKNLWAISIIGAIVHNIGQLTVAVFITQTVQIYWYLPYLIISAVITGAFIGFCVQFTINKAGNTLKKLLE